MVRVPQMKLTFQKGCGSNWPRDLYNDVEGRKSTFYLQKLQRLKNEYSIEKILKKHVKNLQTEYFVKYKGYPNKFNEWIPTSNLPTI